MNLLFSLLLCWPAITCDECEKRRELPPFHSRPPNTPPLWILPRNLQWKQCSLLASRLIYVDEIVIEMRKTGDLRLLDDIDAEINTCYRILGTGKRPRDDI